MKTTTTQLMSRKAREENYRKIAHRLNADYLGKDEYGLIKMLQDFKVMKIGTNKTIKNLVRVKLSEMSTDEAMLFDYYYTVSTGNSSQRFKQSCLFFNSKSLCLPHFLLRNEHLGDRIMNALGVKDIDFPHFPEFSRLYYLKGKDRDYIYAYFDNEPVIEFIKKRKYRSCIEGINYFLLIHSNRKLMRTNQILHWYNENLQFFELGKQRCLTLFPNTNDSAQSNSSVLP